MLPHSIELSSQHHLVNTAVIAVLEDVFVIAQGGMANCCHAEASTVENQNDAKPFQNWQANTQCTCLVRF